MIIAQRAPGPPGAVARGWRAGSPLGGVWGSADRCRPPESSDCGGGRRCGRRVAPRSAESDSTEHGRGLQINQPLQAVVGKRLVDVGLNPRERAFQLLAAPAGGINRRRREADAGTKCISKANNISKTDNQPISLDDSISWCDARKYITTALASIL